MFCRLFGKKDTGVNKDTEYLAEELGKWTMQKLVHEMVAAYQERKGRETMALAAAAMIKVLEKYEDLTDGATALACLSAITDNTIHTGPERAKCFIAIGRAYQAGEFK